MRRSYASLLIPLFLCLLAPFASGQGTDIPAALALGPDGSLYVAGSGMNAAGGTDLLLVAFDPAGKLFGESRIASQTPGSGFGRAVMLVRDTLVIVTGMVPNQATGVYEMVTTSIPRSTLTGVEAGPGAPADFGLSQNYPNPLTGGARIATITYTLGRGDGVRLFVANEQGEVVSVLAEGWKEAGRYETHFDTATLPAGAYYYTLRTRGNAVTKKLLILR